MPLVCEHEYATGWRLRAQSCASARLGRWLAVIVLASVVPAAGCLTWFPTNPTPPEAAFAPLPIMANNPVLIPNQNPELVFETVVDVVDDYFKVDHEIPVRLEGGVLVEGEIDTFPRSASTILEPWNRDAASFYERVEGTLQSTRRRAIVRVLPAEGGFLVDIVIIKELEDVLRPETGSASRAANLRNDNSLRRYVDPVRGTQPTLGWIELGRDVALEQKLLVDLASRFGVVVAPPGGTVPPVGMILPPEWMPPAGGAPEIVLPPDAAPPTGVELPSPATGSGVEFGEPR
jgi:hypothetical protein